MTEDTQSALFGAGASRAPDREPPERAPHKETVPEPVAGSLAAVLKSTRDLMRGDEGLERDLASLPQLAWLFFLRWLDAKEDEREVVEGEAFVPAIESKYRWKAWAGDRHGRTGQELIAFVNEELLPYLTNVEKGNKEKDHIGSDLRLVVSAVFKNLTNRMRNGVLLRRVIDQVNTVDFADIDNVHAMACLYEKMLQEMSESASGISEFYTPRSVVRFMVLQSFLECDDSILDPACGTGGFLVEALAMLAPQADNTQRINQLHGNLYGIEKKPLPLALSNMNLVFHEVYQPLIMHANALIKMREDAGVFITKADVILTNPPFGVNVEKSVSDTFDAVFRSRDATLLFLHSIIGKLKHGGRCGIVLPDGVLFGSDPAATKVKQSLLADCNLHTVVRLQPGSFAPYTGIRVNLLFFEKGKQTVETWYYELPIPEGRQAYTRRRPLAFDEFVECQQWWGGVERVGRVETANAWRVSIEEIKDRGYNLDLTRQRTTGEPARRDPVEIVKDLIHTEQKILKLLEDLQAELAGEN